MFKKLLFLSICIVGLPSAHAGKPRRSIKDQAKAYEEKINQNNKPKLKKKKETKKPSFQEYIAQQTLKIKNEIRQKKEVNLSYEEAFGTLNALIIYAHLSQTNNLKEKSYFAGMSPLHIACMIGDKVSASNLLASKKNIEKLLDKQDNQGNTPLHLAVHCSHANLVNLLLEHKANTVIKNNNGILPLQMLNGMGDTRGCGFYLDMNKAFKKDTDSAIESIRNIIKKLGSATYKACVANNLDPEKLLFFNPNEEDSNISLFKAHNEEKPAIQPKQIGPPIDNLPIERDTHVSIPLVLAGIAGVALIGTCSVVAAHPDLRKKVIDQWNKWFGSAEKEPPVSLDTPIYAPDGASLGTRDERVFSL